MNKKIFILFSVVGALVLSNNVVWAQSANDESGNAIQQEIVAEDIEIESSSVDNLLLEELGIDKDNIVQVNINEDIQENEIQVYTGIANCSLDMDRSVGSLEVKTYDEDKDLYNVMNISFIDENGAPLSTSSIAEGVYNSKLRGTSYVKIQATYKMYTDGYLNVYVNPYCFKITSNSDKVTYMAGDVTFHGTIVSTRNFKDISGTSCSFAKKAKIVSSGIKKGTTYCSARQYFYSTASKRALRLYSDGFHKSSSMYMEYTLNGKKYTGEYEINDI